ncbi:hypothetical protein PVAG01_10882 [Phlyctema vagabunda]|uniref:P-loop containing nucleoside triphosphate hydrolase protein n=1 Tax=Phlyctema vagabunda TaxID=108571 RepID=A0ABR4P3I1_9HELO
MPRVVDKLPTPSQVRPMKVIGVGASRTGTLGLYMSLKMLGFHPFHISELIPYGIQQMKALQETIVASDKPDQSFSRADFDRMWGEYDCIIESPCYLGTSGIQVYLQDPDVKFILTERTPESFSKSIAGSLGAYNARLHRWPLSVAKYFDAFIWELAGLFRLMTFRWSKGIVDPADPAYRKNLEETYIAYMREIKTLVPPERLLVLSLEKGFGWEEICSFLECDVPVETPYPRINSMSEFHEAAEKIVSPALQKALSSILATSAVAAVSIGAWYWRRR